MSISLSAGQSVCMRCGVVSISCGRESLFVNRTRWPRAIRGVALLTPLAVRMTVAPTAPLGDGAVGLLDEPPPHAGTASSIVTATSRAVDVHGSFPAIVIRPLLALGLKRGPTGHSNDRNSGADRSHVKSVVISHQNGLQPPATPANPEKNYQSRKLNGFCLLE